MQLNGYKYVSDKRLYPHVPIILCTRFNLFSETRGRIKGKFDTDETSQTEWEGKRVRAFIDYCLPSVEKQRVKPDAWYILFDEQVGPEINRLLEVLAQWSWIKPIFIERKYGFTNFTKPLDARIRADFPNSEHFVVCRLDSDDSLHTHYFSILEGAVMESNSLSDNTPKTFNFTFGLLHHGNDDCRVFLNERSPFLFSLEPVSSPNLLSPYLRNHKAIEAIEIITERPMWCQHVHGSNIGGIAPNRMLAKLSFSSVCSLFGLKPERKPKAPAAIIAEKSTPNLDAIRSIKRTVWISVISALATAFMVEKLVGAIL